MHPTKKLSLIPSLISCLSKNYMHARSFHKNIDIDDNTSFSARNGERDVKDSQVIKTNLLHE